MPHYDNYKNVILVFTLQWRFLTPMTKKPFKNVLGKGENTGAISPFPTMFLPFQKETAPFESLWNCHLQMLSNFV